ncbi:MAG: hypothetical protein WCL11_29610, partial [Verrucomicrobiota bacterium]
MSRYRSFTQNDDQAPTEGDMGFIGVDCRREPSLLAPTICSWAENKRFTTGAAATRGGMATPVF